MHNLHDVDLLADLKSRMKYIDQSSYPVHDELVKLCNSNSDEQAFTFLVFEVDRKNKKGKFAFSQGYTLPTFFVETKDLLNDTTCNIFLDVHDNVCYYIVKYLKKATLENGYIVIRDMNNNIFDYFASDESLIEAYLNSDYQKIEALRTFSTTVRVGSKK